MNIRNQTVFLHPSFRHANSATSAVQHADCIDMKCVTYLERCHSMLTDLLIFCLILVTI